MNASQPDDAYIIGSAGVVKRMEVARDALPLTGQLVEYRNDGAAIAQLFTNLSENYGSIAALAYKDALILTKECVTTPLIDKLIEFGFRLRADHQLDCRGQQATPEFMTNQRRRQGHLSGPGEGSAARRWPDRHRAGISGHKVRADDTYVIMDGMAEKGDNAQYARPPVRRTTFTVYINPLDFDVDLMMKLRDEWADYPGIKQSLPLGRPGELPAVDPFGTTTTWPMPAVQLANSSLSRTIAFQFDQISLTWRFDRDGDGDGDQYPGYETLADELIERFAEFVKIVDDTSGDSVEVQGCQCFYTNSLEGIGAQRWLTGYLTDWSSATDSVERLDGAEYLGFRVRRVEENDDVKSSSWLQLDEGLTQPPEVDITVVSVRADDAQNVATDPKAIARKLMYAAHRLENKVFEASFSDQMKKEWGVRRDNR